MSTPDSAVAEQIGRTVDDQIFRLLEERRVLLQAATRIAAIDAQIAILQAEKARIDPRRLPIPAGGPLVGGTAVDLPGRSR